MKAFIALFVLLCMTCKPWVASATDIYIAPTAQGAGNGLDAADAYGLDWLSSSGNWSSTASSNKVCPGVTVHLVGTFTGGANSTLIRPPIGGTAGNPITIYFEPGTVLQAPYFGNGASTYGAIQIGGVSYVTVDGGLNGLIQCTDNGSSNTYHQVSYGVTIASGTANISVHNLTIRNIYRDCGTNAACTDVQGAGSTGVYIPAGAVSAHIYSNVISEVQNGVAVNGNVGQPINGLEVDHNTTSNIVMGVWVYMGGITTPNCLIHDNDISGFGYWTYQVGVNQHTDGIFVDGGANHTQWFYPWIYNNYIHGNLDPYGSGQSTAYIYVSSDTGNQGPISATIFNNLLVYNGTNTGWAIGCTGGSVSNRIYNNTIIGAPQNPNPSLLIITTGPSNTVVNNLLENDTQALGAQYYGIALANAIATANYNIYCNIQDIVSGSSEAFLGNAGDSVTWAQWRAAGYDLQSATNCPLLNATTYVPLSNDTVAVGKGANLTALGIPQLNVDKAGNPRPSSGPWDIGAYEYSTNNPVLRSLWRMFQLN